MRRIPSVAMIGVVAGVLLVGLPHCANSAAFGATPRTGSQGPLASLSGKVVDGTTGEPLSAAVVSIKGTPLQQSTDPEGLFVIEKVPVGGVLLEVARFGYKSRELSVSVASDDKTQWTIALARVKPQ